MSLVNLLESINTSFIQIRTVLISRKQQQRLSGINQYLLKQIIHLLKPFQSIIIVVPSASSPTLHLVLPCTLSLRKALMSFDNLLQHIRQHGPQETSDSFDDEHEDEGKNIVKRAFLSCNCFLDVSYIRQRILALLHDMVDLDIRHYCATLLHLDYRSLNGCTNGERIECRSYVREQIKLIEKEQKINNEIQKNKLHKSEQIDSMGNVPRLHEGSQKCLKFSAFVELDELIILIIKY